MKVETNIGKAPHCSSERLWMLILEWKEGLKSTLTSGSKNTKSELRRGRKLDQKSMNETQGARSNRKSKTCTLPTAKHHWGHWGKRTVNGGVRRGHGWKLSIITLALFSTLAYSGAVGVWVPQSRPTLCHPLDWSPPDSSVHGILQARILEWAAVPFSRGSSRPWDQTQASCVTGRFFTIWVTGNRFSLISNEIVGRLFIEIVKSVWQFLILDLQEITKI